MCMNVANILGLGNAAALRPQGYALHGRTFACQARHPRHGGLHGAEHGLGAGSAHDGRGFARCAGASSPFDIPPAVWVTSLSAAVFGVLLPASPQADLCAASGRPAGVQPGFGAYQY